MNIQIVIDPLDIVSTIIETDINEEDMKLKCQRLVADMGMGWDPMVKKASEAGNLRDTVIYMAEAQRRQKPRGFQFVPDLDLVFHDAKVAWLLVSLFGLHYVPENPILPTGTPRTGETWG